MATWRDKYQPASFRGVPFYVDGTESTHGRRIVTHEYPGRDKPYTEDLGRAAVPFALSAFLIGDDYLADRDNLLRAILTPGPGTLIHPYLGTLKVVMRPAKLAESTADGGMARIALECVEAGDNQFPGVSEDAASIAVAAAATSKLAAAASFAKRVAAAVARFVGALQAAVDLVTTVVAVLGRVINGVQSLSTVVLGKLAAGIAAVKAAAHLIATAPAQFAAQVQALLSQIAQELGMQALDPVVQAMAGEVPPDTTGVRDVARADASNAVRRMVAQSALAAQAEAVTVVAFTSRQDAAGVRDRYVDAATAEAGVADDDGYAATCDLRGAVDNYLTTRFVDLPDLVTLDLTAPTSTLELAQRLYGDATREDEIVLRNDPAQPGFLYGPIEVLAA